MTDAEWLILAPFLPPPSRCGRHRKWEMREVVNAIFYILRDDGTWERINHHLVMKRSPGNYG